MPDQTPVPPPPKPPAPPAAPAGPTIHIGEEYGTAKKNLPPAKIVLIAIGAVLVVVLIASFLKRAKPQASGSLDNVTAVEIPGQNSTMVALTFTIHNTSDKILYVRSLQSSIKAPSGDSTAEAVSAVDFDRYFQAFPALKRRRTAGAPARDQDPARRNGRANDHRGLPRDAGRLQPAHIHQRRRSGPMTRRCR